jgi:L-alanine-DL-glutamate epimerase-like enolase superfamily enzyme
MSVLSRRTFLGAAGASPFLIHFHKLAAAEKKQLKIRDLRTMTIQGPSRTYVLVKVVADDGLYGVAEAYGTPGIGVKEQILSMKPGLVGKDPLEIDAIYTFFDEHVKDLSGSRTDGSAHNLMRAASGIEMALWDLAGKALGVPLQHCWEADFVRRFEYTTMRRLATCSTKHPAANGRRK